MPDKQTRKERSAEAFVEMLDPKKFPKDLAAVLIWLVLAILTIYPRHQRVIYPCHLYHSGNSFYPGIRIHRRPFPE